MASASINRPPRQQRPEEKERFYLLPGQGGSAYRRKQRIIAQVAIAVGVLVSLVFAAIVYLIHSRMR